MRIRCTPLALALFLISACGEDNQTISQLRFCDEYAQAVCAQLSNACQFLDAECQTNRVNECIAAGRAATERNQFFLPANAETCLSKVREVYGKLNQGSVALKPADMQAMANSCSVVYRGKAVRNQVCAIEADCANGFICDKAHCGVVTLVAPGAGCANVGEVCPVGYYCGGSTGILACESKAPAKTACDASTPCLEALRCAGGLCVDALPTAADCMVDQDCASHFCEPYSAKCAADLRFAPNSPACAAMATTRGSGPGPSFP